MFSIWPKQPTVPIHFLLSVHQIYVFISHSGRFGRIFCPFSMTEAQFPLESTFPCAYFRSRRPPAVLSALFCLPAAPRLPCGCRRRYTGFPSASDNSDPYTSSGTSMPLSPQVWSTTCVPVSASYSYWRVRSSLPSHGAEAASSSCPIHSFQTLTYRGHKNRTPRIQYLVLFQQNFVLWHADLFCDSSKFSFARPVGGILFLHIKDAKYLTHYQSIC